MGHRATVLLVAGEPALIRDAAATLRSAGYDAVTEASIQSAPDIILRHFETRTQPPSGPMPVLTLDLTQVTGPGLVDVVERGLGRDMARRETTLDYLVAMLRAGVGGSFARARSVD